MPIVICVYSFDIWFESRENRETENETRNPYSVFLSENRLSVLTLIRPH
jgi:hypothetical protein